MTGWLLAVTGFAIGVATSMLLRRFRSPSRAVLTPVGEIDASSPANGDGPPTDWSWEVNREGLFTSASASSLELIGYLPSELIGQPVGMIMDPRELGRAEAMVVSLGVTDSGLSDLVISGQHRDGTTSWFELTIATITDPTGEVLAYRGSCRAIGPEAAQVVTAEHVRARIEAIIADKLLLTAFQPIVDLTTSKVTGVEALSRFVADPSSTPDIWFAEAAGVGLGPELELLAIETALIAARQLPAHLYISINAAPSTCLDDRLRRLLEASPIGLNRIVIELTEHAEVINYEPLNDVLNSLRLGGDIRRTVGDVSRTVCDVRCGQAAGP